MFLGDHWIGTEPFMPEFKTIGLDAVVGSVGNGSTLRLISDIEGVKYTEGRFLPYFFPDTFYEGGDPVKEAKENWVTARRAILRKPIDRIGYGGYLKLALQFPEFVDYVESVCKEFRELYENIKGTTPYCVKRVAVLNCWGKMRAWGCHMAVSYTHLDVYKRQPHSRPVADRRCPPQSRRHARHRPQRPGSRCCRTGWGPVSYTHLMWGRISQFRMLPRRLAHGTTVCKCPAAEIGRAHV